MRKLPIYFILDTSESMVGEPISAVETGLRSMLSTLRKDPYALEMAYLSIITFGTTARQLVPLTELFQFQVPNLVLGSGTVLGAALDLLEKRIAAEVTKTTKEEKGDYKPLVFLMTDGEPTDRWEAAADRFMRNRSMQFVAIGCGPDANLDTLRRITELVLRSDEMNEETLATFFKWISASVASASQVVDSTGSDAKISLEKIPLGDNIKVVDETTPHSEIIPNRYVFLHCKCTKNKKFYLVKYQKTETKSGGFFGMGQKPVYNVVGAFPLDDFEQISQGAGVSVSSNQLSGVAPCPYCQSDIMAHCECGKIHCAPDFTGRSISLICPWCGKKGEYGSSAGFNLGGGAG